MNNYDDIKRFKEKLNMETIDYKEIAESNPNNASQSWAIIKQVATADEPFHPLDQGRSTQPTPSPISAREFTASPLGHPEPAQPFSNGARDTGALNAPSRPLTSAPVQDESFASPLMSALSKALPPVPQSARPGGSAAHILGEAPGGAAFLNALENQFTRQPAAVTEPARTASPASLFDAVGHNQPAATPVQSPVRARPTVLFHAAAPAEAPARAADNMRFNKLFNRKSQSQTDTLPARDMPLSLLLENIALCR